VGTQAKKPPTMSRGGIPHFRCPGCNALHWYLPESGKCVRCKVVSSLTAWIASNDAARAKQAEAVS
jgi:hypothetical protein